MWNGSFLPTLKDNLSVLSSCVVDKPLKAELNPICHLLALFGAHHILHVSRVRVNMGCWILDSAVAPMSVLTQRRIASDFERYL